jgi:hypothetical protein
MLEFIRTAGLRVRPDATLEIAGAERNLREYVRENWTTIKEQFRVARLVVDAVEAATGTSFGEEPEAE